MHVALAVLRPRWEEWSVVSGGFLSGDRERLAETLGQHRELAGLLTQPSVVGTGVPLS